MVVDVILPLEEQFRNSALPLISGFGYFPRMRRFGQPVELRAKTGGGASEVQWNDRQVRG
jgi:hypothetical protein